MILIEETNADVQQSATLLVGAALALGGVVMSYLVVALSKFWIPGRNNFFARWGFTSVVLVGGAWILAQLLLGTLWGLISGDKPISLNENFILTGLSFAAPAFLIFRMARQLDPDRLGCLGFRTQGSGRAALFGTVSYVLLIPGLLGSMMLWPILLQAFGQTPETQDVMRSFFDLQGSALVLPVLFAVFVLPFFEELLFRAFLQPLLVQNFREVGGVVVTSLLFAAMHGLSAFGPVFVLSLILGGVMQRTQRFSSCYAVHALHNGLTIWAILTFSEVREMVDVSGGLLGLLGIG